MHYYYGRASDLSDMSLADSGRPEIERWTGRLLGVAGATLLIEAASGLYGESLAGVPFSWALSAIPFGIGFALAPLVLLRSYQSLADRTPMTAIVGVAFVASLPVGTIVLVGWASLARASDLVPNVTVLPVTISTAFFTLLGLFAIGIAVFGVVFFRDDRTRLLGGSLVLFASGWAIPLAVAKLSGAYPSWLADVLVVSVATSMLVVGYAFPPTEPDRGWHN